MCFCILSYTGDFEQAFQDILEGCEAMIEAGI